MDIILSILICAAAVGSASCAGMVWLKNGFSEIPLIFLCLAMVFSIEAISRIFM